MPSAPSAAPPVASSAPPAETKAPVAAPVVAPPPAPSAAPPRGPEAPLRCADGDALKVGDRQFCLQRKATTFQESQAFCQGNGGQLAELESNAESASLRDALASPVAFETSAWIGLTQGNKKGPWHWSSGGAMTFKAWGAGEPNDSGGVEHCGELIPGTMKWNDAQCELPHPFVCERRAGVAKAADKVACRGAAFRVGTIDYCYHRMQLLAWEGASLSCEEEGSTLASFKTRAELDAFGAAVSGRLAAGRTWIGYSDEAHEGHWTTVTGKTPTFTHWRPGEPNNSGGNEHCAEWIAADGGWNDVACDAPHVGLCSAR